MGRSRSGDITVQGGLASTMGGPMENQGTIEHSQRCSLLLGYNENFEPFSFANYSGGR